MIDNKTRVHAIDNTVVHALKSYQIYLNQTHHALDLLPCTTSTLAITDGLTHFCYFALEPIVMTTQYTGALSTPEELNAFRLAFSRLARARKLSAQHMALQALLTRRSLEKAFSPISSKTKLENGQKPFRSLRKALQDLIGQPDAACYLLCSETQLKQIQALAKEKLEGLATISDPAALEPEQPSRGHQVEIARAAIRAAEERKREAERQIREKFSGECAAHYALLRQLEETYGEWAVALGERHAPTSRRGTPLPPTEMEMTSEGIELFWDADHPADIVRQTVPWEALLAAEASEKNTA